MSRELEAAFFELAKKQVGQTGRKTSEKKLDVLRARLTPKQLAFLDDTHERKVLLSPRRAGKTTVDATELVSVVHAKPGSNSLYVTITREMAKRLMWEPLIKLNNELELGFEFHASELVARHPNGSRIRVSGAENEHDAEKFRGEPYDLVILDEPGSFSSRLLDYLLEQVIEPALGDRMGRLVLTGTPSHILTGLFYDSTGPEATVVRPAEEDGRMVAKARPYLDREHVRWKGVDWEWSQHTWTVADNTAMPHIWRVAQERKRRKGWSDDNPIWQREYLGKWIADDSTLIYKYNAQRNGWMPGERTPENPFGIPDGETHNWRYIMGLDLGFDAAFAVQIAAYSDTCSSFYQVYEFSSPGLNVAQIADAIKRADEVVETAGGMIDRRVGDRGGLGKMIFATLESVYGISIEPADKKDKRDHIEILNSELIEGHCFIQRETQLASEMEMLVWDEDGKEPKKFPKDNCDAFLYLATLAQHAFHRGDDKVAIQGSAEWEAQRQAQEIEAFQEKMRRVLEPDRFGQETLCDLDGWYGSQESSW